MGPEVGLPAVVVPHFNNAEGGTHDTRFCYMGDRRLSLLEAQLPPEVFILGVDEHTACIFDLDDRTASVEGVGSVTVRYQGRMSAVAAGTTLAIADLAALATEEVVAVAPSPPALAGRASVDPLVGDLDRFEQAFDAALAGRDGPAAVKVALELDDLLHDWSRDTTQSDLLDRGRAGLRSMIVRLGEAADEGLRDPDVVVGPFVDALLEARRQARADGRWADADQLRDRLLAAGVEVRDTSGGTEWQLR
jgi:hypothetical protein